MSPLKKLYSKKFFLVNLVLVGVLVGFALAFTGFSLSAKGPQHRLLAETPVLYNKDASAPMPPEVSQALAQATSVQTAFRYVAQTVMPSVVEINVVENKKGNDNSDNQNPWRYFFGQPDDGQGQNSPEYKEEGLGSGIIVRRDGRSVYVLTNNHVAGAANEIPRGGGVLRLGVR